MNMVPASFRERYGLPPLGENPMKALPVQKPQPADREHTLPEAARQDEDRLPDSQLRSVRGIQERQISNPTAS